MISKIYCRYASMLLSLSLSHSSTKVIINVDWGETFLYDIFVDDRLLIIYLTIVNIQQTYNTFSVCDFETCFPIINDSKLSFNP